MVLNALVGSAGLGAHARGAADAARRSRSPTRSRLVVGGELVTDLIKGEPERLLPVDSEHAALAHGAAGRAPRGPQARRAHRLRRPVPWLDPQRARARQREGGPAAPRVVDGPEDHDRLRHAHEQGPRGDRGALPVRPGVLPDPRADPPRGRGARDGGVPRRQPARRDGRSPTCGCRSSSRWPGPSACPPGSSRCRSPRRPLTFEPVDREAFPAVDLAYRVGGLGLTFPAVMNAANEVAVMAFLEGKIPLTRIVEIVQTVVDEHEPASVVSVVQHRAGRHVGAPARRRDHRGTVAQDFPRGPAPRRRSSSSRSSRSSSRSTSWATSSPRAVRVQGRPSTSSGSAPEALVDRAQGRDRVRREGDLPLGGYVKIAGMNPYEENPPEDRRAPTAPSPWQRALTIFAGPGSHFVRRGA